MRVTLFVNDVALYVSVEPGTAVEPTDTTPRVRGGSGGSIKVSETYNAATDIMLSQATKYDTVQAGDTLELPTGYSYTKNEICVSILSSDFSQPGIYRYKLTIGCDDPNYIVDSNSTKYIDVYVVNNAEGTGLTVAGTIIHNGEDVPGIDGSKPSGMPSNSTGGTDSNNNITGVSGGNDSFILAYKLKLRDVSFEHVTQGNMSEANETFKYVITATDSNNPYDTKQPSVVGVTGATVTGDATTQTITLDGIVKNGTTFTVKDITSTSDVTVAVTKGDYKMVYKLDAGEDTNCADGNISFTAGDNNRAVKVTLTKNNVLPTGVDVNYLPYVLLLVIAGAAVCASCYKKHRK